MKKQTTGMEYIGQQYIEIDGELIKAKVYTDNYATGVAKIPHRRAGEINTEVHFDRNVPGVRFPLKQGESTSLKSIWVIAEASYEGPQ